MSSGKIGEELYRFIKSVAKWGKRECFQQLHDYVYGDIHDLKTILDVDFILNFDEKKD